MHRSLLSLLLLTACPGGDDDTGKTEVDVEVCDNEIDDDGDSYADCTDPDCYTSTLCVRTEDDCTNGADDDGDKRQDCDDDDCSDDPACAGVENCTNGSDDDGDGATDCDDTDCKTDPDCRDT